MRSRILVCPQVRQETAENAHRSQQIGAPHDVGDRFSRQRMDCPGCGQKQRQPRVPVGAGRRRISVTPIAKATCEEVHEQRVDEVQRDVDEVIAERIRPVPKHRVVDEIRQRGQWPIEVARRVRPPVRAREDVGQVLDAERAQARVFEDQDAAVDDEAPVNALE
jgi:hypothetical protein